MAPAADLLDMSVPEPTPIDRPSAVAPVSVETESWLGSADVAPLAPAPAHEPASTPSPAAAVVGVCKKAIAVWRACSCPKSHSVFQYDLLWKFIKTPLAPLMLLRTMPLMALLLFEFSTNVSMTVLRFGQFRKQLPKLSELTHPNHVSVYENGVAENGTPYVVMDWVEGETLTSLFKRSKRIDIASFLNIFTQVCEVLTEAHSRNLFHGNLSPDRISIVTGSIEADTVKVCDFGMPIDTVQNAFYMSPEQCLDQTRVDARSDLYSLGCIMYESLVGRPLLLVQPISQLIFSMRWPTNTVKTLLSTMLSSFWIALLNAASIENLLNVSLALAN